MIGRMLEDLYFVGRFGYFYYRAGSDLNSVGFTPVKATKKARARYAWNRTIGR